MNINLTEKNIDLIRKVLAGFPEVRKGVIFGSRAIGNNKKGSDIDIAVFGEKVNWMTTSKLSARLNERLPLPYHFDVVDYTHLENQDLKKHIKEYGKIFYKSEDFNL